MKKISFLMTFVFVLFAVVSCNQSEQNTEDHDHDSTSAVVADNSLTLNNGAKWQMDTSTNSNVVSLKTMTNMFAVDPFPPINAYQVYGNDMSTGLNKMVKECKMTGDDHEALHHWMEPIIRQSNDMKNVSDTAMARQKFDSIKTRVDLFPEYFVLGK